jgi:hypothetical protein
MPSKHQACSQSSRDSWLACKWLWLQSVNSRVLHVCASDMFARCIMEVEAMMSVVSCPFYRGHDECCFMSFLSSPCPLCKFAKSTLPSCQGHIIKLPSCQGHIIKLPSSSCQMHIIKSPSPYPICYVDMSQIVHACKRNKRMQKYHNNVHCFFVFERNSTILKLIL